MIRRADWGHGLRVLAILALLGAAAFPLYWMFVTSMTPSSELFAPAARLVPKLSEIGVYREAFHATSVTTWVINSAIVAVGTTLLSIALAVFPAYALSRFRFRGMGLVGFGLFITQMLPEAMLVVPLYAIFGDLALLNTLTGLILANSAFTVPVITWILKGAIDGVPIDIEEAARIDGCSRFDIVIGVVLPLVAPTLAAAAVIAFFHGWNEYIFAQTLISDQGLRTASVGLAMKRITGRFVLLIATAAVLPLLLYGLISVRTLTDGTEQSVSRGNQAVAQQIEPLVGFRPEGYGEHPDEAAHRPGSPLGERFDDHLGIARSEKSMAQRFQVFAYFAKIVDLSVEYHYPAAVLRSHGLMP